jgi:hypothetical protein
MSDELWAATFVFLTFAGIVGAVLFGLFYRE